MIRCRTLAAVLAWSIEVVKYGSRSEPIYGVRRWVARRIDPTDLFWSRVNKAGSCWLWTAATDKDGYGKFQITISNRAPKQRHYRAHRYSFFLTHGRWPSTSLLHSCHTPACVKSGAHRRGHAVAEHYRHRAAPDAPHGARHAGTGSGLATPRDRRRARCRHCPFVRLRLLDGRARGGPALMETRSVIDVSASGHYVGDCRELLARLPERCVQTCITSPPYWGLRDYGLAGQIGLEATPELYVVAIVEVFRAVRRVLRDDGTLWVNLGDCYAGSGRGGYTGGRSTLEGSTEGQEQSRLARSTGHHKGGSKNPAGFHEPVRLAGGCSRVWSKPPPGYKAKDLVGVPWLVAFALRADGWYLRADIIWDKPNPMPEPVSDRPTKSHEYLFLLSKRARYLYNADAIREPLAPKTLTTFGTERRRRGNDALGGVKSDNFGRDVRQRRAKLGPGGQPIGANKRSVWTVASHPYDGAHFATFPPKLIDPCVLAGSRPGDLVLDPFFGSGTTGQVAEKHGRRWVGFDLGYEQLAKERTAQRSLRMGAP